MAKPQPKPTRRKFKPPTRKKGERAAAFQARVAAAQKKQGFGRSK